MKCLSLVGSCMLLNVPLHAFSSIVIGGGEEAVSGDYAVIYEFAEEYEDPFGGSPDPDDPFQCFANTNYVLTSSYDIVEGAEWVWDGEDFIEPDERLVPYLSGAPAGMELTDGDYLDDFSDEIVWHTPQVDVPTEYSFEFGVRYIVDGEVLETLSRTVTVTVVPSLPSLEGEGLLPFGIRAYDPIWSDDDDVAYASLSVYFGTSDPDAGWNVNQLRWLEPDPRLLFMRESVDDEPYLPNWNLRWNEAYSVPICSELIELEFDLIDTGATGRRNTRVDAELMVFGYDFEQQRIAPPTPSNEGFFGASVALDDTSAFVAEPGTAVHIYEAVDGVWQIVQTLDNPLEKRQFGGALAIHDGVLAVAAPLRWPDGDLDHLDVGAVYLYRYDVDLEEWRLFQMIEPDAVTYAEVFAGAVDFAQTATHFTLMVSADGGEDELGAAWVYEWDADTQQFIKKQVIASAGAVADDYFSWPLSVKGDVAVFAANEDDHLEDGDNSDDAGAVYVYRRNGTTGAWEFEQKLTASDASWNDLFGERVVITDYGIVVSAFRKRADATELGAVYFFENSEGVWSEGGVFAQLRRRASGSIIVSVFVECII